MRRLLHGNWPTPWMWALLYAADLAVMGFCAYFLATH